MTPADSKRLDALRLCDLHTKGDGVRYRSIGDAADIIAFECADGTVQLRALVYPFHTITRPFTAWGLRECKSFVRRWA